MAVLNDRTVSFNVGISVIAGGASLVNTWYIGTLYTLVPGGSKSGAGINVPTKMNGFPEVAVTKEPSAKGRYEA
jgi:hypothetical protein